jgi:hypothetical protein
MGKVGHRFPKHRSSHAGILREGHEIRSPFTGNQEKSTSQEEQEIRRFLGFEKIPPDPPVKSGS